MQLRIDELMNENALFKLVYCAIDRFRTKWTHPVQNWAIAVSQLHIHFGDRMTIELH